MPPVCSARKNGFLQYLEKHGQAGKEPLHDLIQMIKLPQNRTSEMNLADWGDAVLKCGPSMARLVKFADKLPVPVSVKIDGGKTWSMQKTREAVAEFAYEKAAKNPALALLCLEHAVEERDFNRALELSKKAPKIKNVPDIVIDGAEFDMPGAVFHRLAPDDIRGLFLGELTDCCQSIGGVGQQCATHGFTSKDGGFYVVEKKDDHRIVGQSWGWRGTKKELVLDSDETLGKSMTAAQWLKLTLAFKEALEKKPGDVTALHLGKGGGTPKSLLAAFKDAVNPAKLRNYTGYRDSKEQVVVWRRPAVHPA